MLLCCWMLSQDWHLRSSVGFGQVVALREELHQELGKTTAAKASAASAHKFAEEAVGLRVTEMRRAQVPDSGRCTATHKHSVTHVRYAEDHVLLLHCFDNIFQQRRFEQL